MRRNEFCNTILRFFHISITLHHSDKHSGRTHRMNDHRTRRHNKGIMLEGEQAVKEGMIDEVGGIKEAFAKLHSLIDKEKEKQENNLMT